MNRIFTKAFSTLPRMLWPVSLLLLLTGCATTRSIQPGSGATFQVRGKSFDDVWKAATKAVARDFMILEYDREKGVIKAKTREGVVPGGGMVGIFITSPAKESMEFTIEVSSLNQYGVQVSGEDWEASIVAGIKAELDQGH